ILNRTSYSLIQNSHLITKVFFPRLMLPLSAIASILLDLCIASLLMAVLMAAYHITPGLQILLLPLVMALAAALALGFGLVAAAFMVTYRDVQHVLPFVMQLLLYASPVGYSTLAVPQELRGYYRLNPVASLLDATRWCLLRTERP